MILKMLHLSIPSGTVRDHRTQDLALVGDLVTPPTSCNVEELDLSHCSFSLSGQDRVAKQFGAKSNDVEIAQSS